MEFNYCAATFGLVLGTLLGALSFALYQDIKIWRQKRKKIKTDEGSSPETNADFNPYPGDLSAEG